MSQELLQFLPAASILFVMLAVVFLIVLRLPADHVVGMLDQRGFVLIAVFTIFSLTLALHLYQNQTWTADILKVVIAVVVGVAATYSSKEQSSGESSSLRVEGSSFGDLAKIAGRDINETVQRIRNLAGDIHEMRDSVVHQNQYIQQVAKLAEALPPLASQTDYLFVVAPNGTDDMLAGQMPDVISQWAERGWRFSSIGRGSGPSWIYTFLKKAEGPPVVRVERL